MFDNTGTIHARRSSPYEKMLWYIIDVSQHEQAKYKQSIQFHVKNDRRCLKQSSHWNVKSHMVTMLQIAASVVPAALLDLLFFTMPRTTQHPCRCCRCYFQHADKLLWLASSRLSNAMFYPEAVTAVFSSWQYFRSRQRFFVTLKKTSLQSGQQFASFFVKESLTTSIGTNVVKQHWQNGRSNAEWCWIVFSIMRTCDETASLWDFYPV